MDVGHDVRVLHHVLPPVPVGARKSHSQPNAVVEHPHTPCILRAHRSEWWQSTIGKDDSVSPDIFWRSFLSLSSSCSYPIVFAIVVLPPTVVRFHYGFGSQRHIPNAWAFIIQFVFCLSGALNVLLFLTTRSGLLLPKAALGKTAPLWQPADDDEEKGQSHLNIDAESLRHSDVANARPVERGERPMALAALPGVEDISDEW